MKNNKIRSLRKKNDSKILKYVIVYITIALLIYLATFLVKYAIYSSELSTQGIHELDI